MESATIITPLAPFKPYSAFCQNIILLKDQTMNKNIKKVSEEPAHRHRRFGVFQLGLLALEKDEG